MINVIIADDHPIFRKGVVYILEQNAQIKIIGEAENGKEAVELIKSKQPQIAILDIDMPELTGLDVVRQMKYSNTACKFIILTMLKEFELYEEIKSIGVHGYLLKDSASENLVNCIIEVNNGNSYIDPFFQNQIHKKSHQAKLLDGLTKSEKNIIKLIARKLSTKEIAEMLFVSTKTIENHRSNICKKLEISGTNAIFNYIIEHDIKHI